MNPADIFKSSLFGQSSPSMSPSTPASSLFKGPSGAFSPTLSSSVLTPTQIPSGPQSKLPTSSTGGNNAATAPVTPKAAYINSQTGTTATTAPSTAPVNSTTGVNANYAFQSPGNPTTPPGNVDTTSPDYQYQQAFNQYLQSLQPTTAETDAEKALSAQQLQASKNQDTALEKPGQTLAFASGEAARVARNDAYQTDALSNTVNALTGARTARTNATQAQLDFEKGLYTDAQTKAAAAAKPDYSTVSPGSTVFDNKTGKSVYTAPTTSSQNPSTAPIGGTYAPGADPTVDGYVAAINAKQATLAQVPAAYKSLVAQGLASAGQASTLKTDALTSAQQLLQSFQNSGNFLGAKTAVGASSVLPVIPGTQEADFVNNLNNLKSLLSLDNVKYLKGQGAISDSERQLLADAATQLNRSQSEGEFQATLNNIITSLNSSTGGGSSSGGGFTAQAGGQTYTFPDQKSLDAFKKEAGIQ